MRWLIFMLMAGSVWAQTADWTTTNQVAPYSPTVNVPHIHVPRPTVVEPAPVIIPAATNPVPAAAAPAKRGIPAYVTAPTLSQMASDPLKTRPPPPLPPVTTATGGFDTNNLAITSEPLVLTNAPATPAESWPETRTPAESE